MRSVEEQRTIRADIFRWLDSALENGQYEFTRDELANYHYDGTRIPLVDRGRGIRNPVDFDSTLSIMTSFDSPYADMLDPTLLSTYDYRVGDSADNRKLQAAHKNGDPLVYFRGVRRGVYIAYYPVHVLSDDPVARKFTVSFDETLQIFGDPTAMTEDLRRYGERTVQVRLHQPVFRAKVLHAYATSCAMCQLRQPSLLDAAHIIPDAAENGFAQVSNGLALCKLHHVAYDRDLIGVSPDYDIRVSRPLMAERGGPMLRYGIQDLHGRQIDVPHARSSLPSKDALETRFIEFLTKAA